MSMLRFSDELHYIARGAVSGVGAGQSLNGISFPSNADAPTNDYVAIEFDRPDLDGLPIWGPSNAGVTVIMEKMLRQQTAEPVNNSYYYQNFWYTNADRTFDVNHYWGWHPYPQGGSPGTNPVSDWEVAGFGAGLDHTATRPNETGPALQVVLDTWFTQAIAITKSGTTEACDCYLDLPSTSNGNIISISQNFATYGEAPETASLLVIGDSPWYSGFQHERFSGILGRIKIFAAALSEADILSEAADMSDVVTAAGQAAIWWGKNNFTSLDDLTCDYGTGRSFAWNNSARGTLVAINP